jgi:Ala-tRNA(Pro) deacylase
MLSRLFVTVSDVGPYQALVAHLRISGVQYREFTHPPAASALEYHQIVGSRLEHQAKALLFRRYGDDGSRSYLIYALPGSAEADIERLLRSTQSRRLRLATRGELQQQTGCRFGELPPVGSIFGCQLAFDSRLLGINALYFNAGCLDRSIVMDADTLVALEAPIIVQ